MTPEQLTDARKIAAISAPGSGVALLVEHIDAQVAEIERLRTALCLAVRQNECDMLMTGEELRLCRSAMKEAK